jgi:hypothetical protein
MISVSQPSPPDLSKCTRVEIQFKPSTLDWVCSNEQSVLSGEERTYLSSLNTLVADDPEAIKDLAAVVRRATYDDTLEGSSPGAMSIKNSVVFACYQQKEHLTTFTWQWNEMICSGHWFKFEGHGPPLSVLAPQIQAFRLRCSCVLHLRNLMNRLERYARRQRVYPGALTWCDVFVKYYSERGYTADVSRFSSEVTCPAAGEGKCHYAMNPACGLASPPDMVLLFETKAGWNQHGGPELFTFDNHDPKGGLVLLNDGTVKFIRSEEELKQLRWK